MDKFFLDYIIDVCEALLIGEKERFLYNRREWNEHRFVEKEDTIMYEVREWMRLRAACIYFLWFVVLVGRKKIHATGGW